MNIRSQTRSILLLGAGLSLALLAGCATSAPAISSHPDTAVNYAQYKSFMMLKPAGLAPARNPAITPSLVRELREEAATAFTAKGMIKSSNAYSDALILVHGGMQDKLEVQEWGLSYGRFGRGRQELDAYKEGTIFVDVFDSQTRELIWRGSAVAQVSAMPESAQLKATIDSIIARYPN